MKIATTLIAQGDCLFVRVDGVPADAVRVETPGPLVVAHSETGHDHVVESAGVQMYHAKHDPLSSYLLLGDAAVHGIDIVHRRAWDTHETVRLLGTPGDAWLVRRQREWTPEGWRRVED